MRLSATSLWRRERSGKRCQGPPCRDVHVGCEGRAYRANDVAYQSDSPTEKAQKALDVDTLHEILEATHQHVDCQVCYNLLLDPVTTFCGHTLCRIASHEAWTIPYIALCVAAASVSLLLC